VVNTLAVLVSWHAVNRYDQVDRITRAVLGLLAGLTTVMCLPDHFEISTWPFTIGYMALYVATLWAIARMRPQGGGREAPDEPGIRWRDLPPGLRRARLLTAGLVVLLGAFYVPHWLHSPEVTGAVCLAGAIVVAVVLAEPGSVRLGTIAMAAVFLLVVASPLEYTNHVFLPEKGVAGHVTLGVGFAGLLAASLVPVRARWLLVFMLVLGSALRVESLLQWPMDPLRRDMPVLMNHGIQSLLDGRFPYRVYFCSHDVPQTYLPMLWLTHLPFVAAGLDMRWGQLVATLVTAVVIWEWGRGGGGLRQVGLFLATLFYLMPETIWSVVHAEPPSFWLWGALAFWGFVHRRFLLAALFFGISLGTRHFAYLMVPFVVIWYAWVVRSRKEALLYLLVAAAVASVIVMPFALEGPVPFVFGTLHWLTKFGETHRTWWHIYISFAPLFYTLSIEHLLVPIQAASFAVVLVAALLVEGRARRPSELAAAWRPWWFMSVAYIVFLMFNSIIWRYLHVMPIVNLAFLVALRLQNRPASPRRGSPRMVAFVRRPVAYPVVAGLLAAVFLGSLGYMVWAYRLSRDVESVEEHARRVTAMVEPGDLLVDHGLFNAWPIMEGAVFQARELPEDVRYVIRLRSQFPPAYRRVLYFDGVDLFDPRRDVPDLLTYMRYRGFDEGERSQLHVFDNPHPVEVTWRLSWDPDRILRSELTARAAGVALGSRRRNARFFFHEAAPPGYFSGWHVQRSMFHRWSCVLARPPGRDREIRVDFEVPHGGRAWLVTGLDDYAVWASRPAVDILIEGPGLGGDGAGFSHPNEQGLYVWALGEVAGGGYTATVTAPSHEQRVFCFDVALSEPAGPGRWGRDMDLGM
jgi:hypothetical protein